MQFKENKAIYLQIADLICEDIATGKFKEDEKIPSVREYATTLEVNANTCARAFDWLQGMDIIYTKRGLGYFVTEGAKETVLSTKRTAFFLSTLPEMASQMKILGISINEVTKTLKEMLK